MALNCDKNTTGMLACRIPGTDSATMLAEKTKGLSGLDISCLNSPHDFVLGGPLDSLKQFSVQSKAEGLRHKVLDVPFAFHSPAMEPILGDLFECASQVNMRAPSIQTGSSLYGRLLDSETVLDTKYFVDHSRETVKFSGLLTDLAHQFDDYQLTVLEIGPSPSSMSILKPCTPF